MKLKRYQIKSGMSKKKENYLSPCKILNDQTLNKLLPKHIRICSQEIQLLIFTLNCSFRWKII